MDIITQTIKKVIDNTTAQINSIVKTEHPKILAEIAKDIFSSGGQAHGRNWQPNTKNTTKKKGFNKRNYETGLLENTLEGVGFLEDDNYMDNLPTPTRGSSYGYKAANAVGDPNNRFDNIGRTEADDQYMSEQLADKISQSFAEKSNG